MKMKWRGLSVLLILVFLLAACSPKAATPVMEDEKMEDEMMDEEMEESEDEMADEEDMADEEEMEDSEDEMMDEEMAITNFVVRLENISTAEGLTVLAPGAYELNDHPVSFFTPGEADRGEGLEALAEDGDPSVLVGSINQMMAGMDDGMMSFVSDVFNTPVGADAPGPVGPGGAYEFAIAAYPGQYLTFASMFVHSNDWFFAPDQEGIALFDVDGNPLSDDITDLVYLWNAGTEVDQTPGEGADQPPSQAGPNTGETENGVVALVEDFDNYQILVTITPQ